MFFQSGHSSVAILAEYRQRSMQLHMSSSHKGKGCWGNPRESADAIRLLVDSGFRYLQAYGDPADGDETNLDGPPYLLCFQNCFVFEIQIVFAQRRRFYPVLDDHCHSGFLQLKLLFNYNSERTRN